MTDLLWSIVVGAAALAGWFFATWQLAKRIAPYVEKQPDEPRGIEDPPWGWDSFMAATFIEVFVFGWLVVAYALGHLIMGGW